MDLTSAFLSSIISSGSQTPEAFLGEPYEQKIHADSPLFHIL